MGDTRVAAVRETLTRLEDVSDALVAGAETSDDRACGIGRVVIDNDDLEGRRDGRVLFKHRSEGSAEQTGAIVGGQDDRQAWRLELS